MGHLTACTKVGRIRRLLPFFIITGATFLPGMNFSLEAKKGNGPAITQQAGGIVSGSVIDAKTGESLIGAVIMFNDRNDVATITDVDGKFALQVPDTQTGTLTVSTLGFKVTKIEIKGRKVILIPLEEDVAALEEVVITGYTTQKKGSVIGSIDRIQPAQLKLPTRTVSTSLAGRLAGVIAVQGTGEPGYDGATFWIRGINTFTGKATPLILIDGIERSLDNIDPEEIADFTILKDATATATYGVRGGNGVVLITTRKGSAGAPRISVRAESGFYSPVDLPEFVDGPTFMRIANEAQSNMGNPALYTAEDIERTANGYDPYMYPNVDWMSELTRKASPAQRANINVSGGGENIRYFLAAAVLHQNGMFKSFNEGASFNNNITTTRYNFRSNVDANVTKSTILSVGLAAILEDRNFPGEGTSTIFGHMRKTLPVSFPMTLPDDTKTPGFIFDAIRNPYQLLARSGYQTENHVNIQSNFSINQDLSALTQGLQFKGIFSFDSSSDGKITRLMKPRPYMITGKDENGEYIYQDQAPTDDSFHDYLERTVNTTVMERRTYLETSLVYNRSFGQHTVGGLLLYNQNDKQFPSESNIYASVPSRNQGLTGRTSYSFRDKYFAEFNFGYNGSENFVRGRRYGFFPAVAVGWVPTAEPFMGFLKPAIEYMKIRFSHGTVGNDNLADSDGNAARFVYLTRVEYADDSNVGFGTSDGYGYGSGSGINFSYYGNEFATWEESRKTDLGLELNFLKGFQLQFDLFYEKRVNIWAQMNKIPDLFGFTIIPYANVGEMDNRGFDGFLEYTKALTRDLSFNAKATFSFSRNKILANGDVEEVYEYQSKIGRPHNSLMGYLTDGYFIDDAHVAASPTQRAIDGTTPKAGDLKYKDVNGDGVVDTYDRVFMGYPSVPEVTYGLGLGVVYKGFDLSLLFQGADRVSFFAVPKTFELVNSGNVYTFIVDNYWTEDNPDPYAAFPRLGVGTQTYNYTYSDKWLQNGRYVRIKQTELGYSLPSSITQKWGIGSLRIYTNGLNLLTWSPFKWWDAESKNATGAYYPVQRVVNFGIEVKF